MTSGGRYDREVQLGKEQTAEAMALIGSEPVAEKQGAQLFHPPHPESHYPSPAPYHFPHQSSRWEAGRDGSRKSLPQSPAPTSDGQADSSRLILETE